MDHENYCNLPPLLNIETGIGLGSDKTDQFQPRVYLFVEIWRRLFGTIKRLVELQDLGWVAMISLGRVDKDIVRLHESVALAHLSEQQMMRKRLQVAMKV